MSRAVCLVPLFVVAHLLGCEVDNGLPLQLDRNVGFAGSCSDPSTWHDREETCSLLGTCTVLIKNAGDYGGRCSSYCARQSLTCVAAADEHANQCVKKTTPVYTCDDAISGTGDIICTCEGEPASPTEAPTESPTLPVQPTPPPTPPSCTDSSTWENKDETCNEYNACTVLITNAQTYGGRCSTYCASIPIPGHAGRYHTCVSAADEESNTCVKKTTPAYLCDDAISGTSDIICECSSVPLAPTEAPTLAPTPPPTVPTEAPTQSPTPPTPPPGQCVEFLVIGDQGLGASGVAAGLSHVANIKHPNAILGVGDHVYAHGAEGSYDKLVSRFIEKFITDPDLGQTLHVPWYMVTGNHDWESDASWERSFTDAEENEGGYWRMPDFWYKQQFLADGFTVDVFFIDTQVWINSDDDKYYHRASLGAGAKQDQLSWLTAQLGESTAQWKIVVGHHPMYSQGNKGMTDELHPDLEPLMREHGVQIYFSGHSHNQQLIQFDGMNYVISGAGVVSSDGVKTEYPEDAIISKHVSLGFAGLSVCSSSESALIFYDGAGAELASHTFPATPPQPSAGTPCLANGDYCE